MSENKVQILPFTVVITHSEACVLLIVDSLLGLWPLADPILQLCVLLPQRLVDLRFNGLNISLQVAELLSHIPKLLLQ